MTPVRLDAARRALAARLGEAGVEDSAVEARALVRAATGLDAAGQAAAPERALTAAEAGLLETFAARRMAGEPLQHITGFADFWTLRLRSDARALAPRGDTETIVRAALAALPDGGDARILDLGVGGGAILLAVLSERPRARGVGVDASAGALSLARENADLCGLPDRVMLVEGSWDAALAHAPFDLVVSNPPYIRSAEIASLPPEVRRDPHAALDGGVDGLDAYREILALLPRLLAPGARAVLEIGADQAAEVRALADTVPGLVFTGLEPDLEGRDRALIFARETLPSAASGQQ